MTTPFSPGKPYAPAPDADFVWTEFRSVLASLAPEVRAPFLLHEIFEADDGEISDLTGLTEATCRSHIEHARTHAAEHMRRFFEKKEVSQR